MSLSYKFFLTTLILVFIGTGLSSIRSQAQGLDHCPACKWKPREAAPAPSTEDVGRCPNLTGWSKSFHSAHFKKKFEHRLYQNISAQFFKQLSAQKKLMRFLESFEEVTQNYKRSFRGQHSNAIDEIRQRLLSSVGWKKPNSFGELEEAAERDSRIAAVIKQQVCQTVKARNPKELCDGDISDLKSDEKPKFLEEMEDTLVDFLAEGVSIEEMIRAEILPTTQTWARLVLSLMNQYEVPTSLVLALPKASVQEACEKGVGFIGQPTVFAVTESGEHLYLTLMSQNSKRLATSQGFPMTEEWFPVIRSSQISTQLRVPMSETENTGAAAELCHLNREQVRVHACNAWRTQQ